jgi:hypothetical protein
MDTYIQNQGVMKTLLHNRGHNSINQIGWNADYDGNMANVSLGINNNGKMGQYQFQLDNQDLEDLLSIPSVNRSLDQRLLRDFSVLNKKKKEPLFVIVERPHPKTKMVDEKIYTHLSSPRKSEQLILPLTIKNKNKKTKRNKSARTYRVYKAPNSSSSRRRTRRRITF